MKSNLTFIKKPELFAELLSQKDEFFAVIDQNLKPHLPDWLLGHSHVFWLTHAEAQKTLSVFEEIVEFFLQKGVSRSSTIIAIGGGATTDLTGFVASTILRGISWTAIPTSLLGMVDGSIGGKVAVNSPQGKNLMGAFHAPKTIFICQDFLSTLPKVEWQSGCGEILKYGFLSPKIHDLILNKANMDVIAFECAQYKMEVVERDFKESGERILLNLGHTLGHAFESSLKIPHGLAVAMGIRYLLKVFSQNENLKKWEELSSALNLPREQLDLSTYADFSVDKLKKYIEQDKKKDQQKLKLVMIRKPGDCYIEEVPFSDFMKKIGEHEAFH